MTAPHMPMMNDEGLLECPFCGSNEARLYSGGGYCVICKCGCSTDDWLVRPAAIRQWNTRNGHLYTSDNFNQAAEERDYGL